MHDKNHIEELEIELLRVRIEREKIQLEHERLRQSTFKDSRNMLLIITHLPFSILKKAWIILGSLLIFIKKRFVHTIVGLFLIFGFIYLFIYFA